MCLPQAAGLWLAFGDRTIQGQWCATEACQPGTATKLQWPLSYNGMAAAITGGSVHTRCPLVHISSRQTVSETRTLSRQQL